MPKHSSWIGGVCTAKLTGTKGNYSHSSRGPEDKLVYHDERIKSALTNKRLNLDLCKSHELPEGIKCEFRVERNGIYFCKSKENCPLISKER